jgi:hypothetical protein
MPSLNLQAIACTIMNTCVPVNWKVMTEFVVFWVVATCSILAGYQWFGGLCSLNLQGCRWRLHNHYTTQCNDPENYEFYLYHHINL